MPHAATLPPGRTAQPHAATVFASARPPHPATVAQPRFARVHPALAFQRGIVQRARDDSWAAFDDFTDFESAPKAVAPKAGGVTCGSRISVYSERAERLVPEVGAIAAWVVVGETILALSNAHVVGTDLGLDPPDTGYPVDASEQLIGWTSIYNRISKGGGTCIDAGLICLEPGTVLNAHPLVSKEPRDLDKDPLKEGEPLYMSPGPDRDKSVKVVEATFKQIRHGVALAFTSEISVKMDSLYELTSKKDFVSIPGESGGLWVDGQGRPTLHNNWGTSDKDGSGDYFGGGTKLVGKDSAFAWIQSVLGKDARLYFGDAVVEEKSIKDLYLPHFNYLPVAQRELEHAYLSDIRDLKDRFHVPEEHHGAVREAYDTYSREIARAKCPSVARQLITDARHAFGRAITQAEAEYKQAKKLKHDKAAEQKGDEQGGGSVAFLPPPKSGKTRTKK